MPFGASIKPRNPTNMCFNLLLIGMEKQNARTTEYWTWGERDCLFLLAVIKYAWCYWCVRLGFFGLRRILFLELSIDASSQRDFPTSNGAYSRHVWWLLNDIFIYGQVWLRAVWQIVVVWMHAHMLGPKKSSKCLYHVMRKGSCS